jgi:hypothetical protein
VRSYGGGGGGVVLARATPTTALGAGGGADILRKHVFLVFCFFCFWNRMQLFDVFFTKVLRERALTLALVRCSRVI